MKICIDSQFIIWGIKNQGDQGMVDRAKFFFEWADSTGHEIIIPTIVIAEILSPEPVATRIDIYNELNTNFIIAPFDALCALKYAEIMNTKGSEVAKEQAKDAGISRQKMKCDHLIIATALAHGAVCVYSEDEGVVKFGSGIIDVRSMPHLPTKTRTLFD